MRKRIASIVFVLLATCVCAAPALAADSPLTYLLVVNTASKAFKLSGMTLGGKACPACADRSIAPGASVMVKIGVLGSAHLKFSTIAGGKACHYDFAANGASSSGDCKSSVVFNWATDVHDEGLFDTDGKPDFTLVYASDPVKGQ